MPCDCDNCRAGFNCMVEWCKAHPGDTPYNCEWCGLYNASKPRCNKCEEDD